MRILGIDPGIATVGFGFVDQACGCALRPVQYGAITTEAGLPLATRLVQINRDLEELIETFRPDLLYMASRSARNNERNSGFSCWSPDVWKIRFP